MTFICHNGLRLALEDLSDGQYDCPGGEDEAIIPKILKRWGKSELTRSTTTVSPVPVDSDENCQSVWWEELLKALAFMIVGGLIEIILLYITKKLNLWGAAPVERNNRDERQEEDMEMNINNNNPFLDSGLFTDSTRYEDSDYQTTFSTEEESGVNELQELFDPIVLQMRAGQPIQ